MVSGSITLHPIGVVHAPYRSRTEAPRQGRFTEVESTLEIFPRYQNGLEGIQAGQYLFVLWWADQAERNLLRVVPPHETTERGVFAARSPARPNPIALSLVQVVSLNGGEVRVRWLEALDGTRILDIKPYSPKLDCVRED